MLILLLFINYNSYRSLIGRSSCCGHRAVEVVVNSNAVIGANVLIRVHVGIAKKTPDGMAPVSLFNSIENSDDDKIIDDVSISEHAAFEFAIVMLTCESSRTLIFKEHHRIIELDL